jgi:hypothetical protein
MTKRLHINDKAVTIDEVSDNFERGATCGFVSVYVNGYASCHKLPAEWYAKQGNGLSIITSGNIYSFK